jgi:hypothetical protein
VGSGVAEESRREDEGNRLSVTEMQNWLRQELADLAKANELRTKEATSFVASYASGAISPEEAEKRLHQYDRRWPEALPGTHTVKGATDAELLAEIDEASRPDFVERLMERGRQRSGSKKK